MAHTLRFWWGAEDKQTARVDAVAGTPPDFEETIVSLSRVSAKWTSSGRIVRFRQGFNTNGTWNTADIDHWWAAFDFYIAALPSGGDPLQTCDYLDSVGTENTRIRITSTGAVGIWNRSTATWEDSSGTISAGRWYVVSFQCFRSGALQVIVRDKATGATVASKTHSSNLGNLASNNFRIGWTAGASGGPIYYDNVVCENSNTSSAIDDPVNLLTHRYAVGQLMPTTVGAYDGWTGAFGDVDEFPHDSDTSFRSNSGTVAAFTQGLQLQSSLASVIGTIHGVQAWDIGRDTGGATATQLRLRSGSTDSDAVNLDIGGTYAARQKIYLTDPATAGSWFTSALDEVEVGVHRTTTTGGEVRSTEVGLDVLYTVTAISRQKKVHYQTSAWDPRQRILDSYGKEIAYDEIESDKFLRILDVFPMTTAVFSSLHEQPDIVYIEEVTYTQDEGGVAIEIAGSPDDFVERLSTRLQNLPSGV